MKERIIKLERNLATNQKLKAATAKGLKAAILESKFRASRFMEGIVTFTP